MPAKNGFRCLWTRRVYPAKMSNNSCSITNCSCPAPNGFGPDGNRVCLRFGPARWRFDAEGHMVNVDHPSPAYEVCDFCDNMVLETEMGAHECPEAVAELREVAVALLAHEAGEDSEEEEATPLVAK